jgi:FKBP-type peptidyl-prolyl cis-trans isomerase (trigger factor)
MPLSREEIEKRMVELARRYVETHDPEIIKELYKLVRELEKMEKSEKQ